MSLLNMILNRNSATDTYDLASNPLEDDYVAPEPDALIIIKWELDKEGAEIVHTLEVTVKAIKRSGEDRRIAGVVEKWVRTPFCPLSELHLNAAGLNSVIADTRVARPDKITYLGASRTGHHYDIVVWAKSLGNSQWQLVSWD